MRLAVFTNQFPSLSPFFARDMRALVAQGIEVDVFPIYPLDSALWRYVSEARDEQVFPRARVHHVGLRASVRLGNGGGLARVARFARDAAAITGASLRGGPASVAKGAYAALKGLAWAHEYPTGGYDHVLAYWGNYAATSAYVFHRLTDRRVPFSMIVHARMDLYHRPVFLAQKMAYADNIFLVCEFNRHYLARRFPRLFPRIAEKIQIHHLGLDLTEVRFSSAPRPPAKLLAVGRFEALKGFHVLLRAAKALHERGIPVDVELVGGGEREGELRALAAELGIARHVVFRPWLPSGDVLEAMRQATVLVHPPVTLDAMPTVIKEALAVGTPVVASDLAGIPEILDQGRCGMLVPPGDVGALADALEALLRNPSLRHDYGCAGRRHAERLFDLWHNGQRLAARLRSTGPRIAG